MSAKPDIPAPDFDKVPTELRERPQWVMWRSERDGDRWTKRPYQVKAPPEGRNPPLASTTDPKTWSPFDEARTLYGAFPDQYDGIGYVFAGDDPYTGVDVDNCLAGGELLEWADPAVGRLRLSYGETSPSGNGIKFIVRGRLPGDSGTRHGGYGPDGKGAFEAYDHARFFTITGDRWLDSAPAIVEVPGEPATLYAEIQAERARRADEARQARRSDAHPANTNGGGYFPPALAPAGAFEPVALPDDELLRRMFRSKHGAEIEALFNGDNGRYPSESEGDLALTNHFSWWTRGDAARVERLFCMSQRARRDKWDRDDYRARTIGKAVDGLVGGYQGDKLTAVGNHVMFTSTFATGQASRNGDGGGGGEEPEILDLWPKIDPKAYHGIAGEIVWAVDPHTESDPVATLVQFLVAMGNLIGRTAHFQITATQHYLNLFAVLVGDTADGRKGTSWDIVEWLLGSLDEGWRRDCVQSGLSTGEGLIYHVRDPITKREAKRAGKGGPVTGYEDVITDDGVAEKRMMIVESEFGSTIKAMNRKDNTLSDIIRKAWDCKSPLRTMSKNSANRATGAHVSIIGHITRADIAAQLNQTDMANGFGNRFLWPCVRRCRELPDGGNIGTVNWTPIRNRLDGIVKAARTVGRMSRDDEASARWREAYGPLSAGQAGLLGKMIGRRAPQVVRLSCLYALLDKSAVVRAEHIDAALALWDYCEASARYIFGVAPADVDEAVIMGALREAPEGLTRSAINDLFHGKKSGKEIAELLGRMLTKGIVHRRKGESRGGRPPEFWFAGRGPAE
jgi:hypothetical protein